MKKIAQCFLYFCWRYRSKLGSEKSDITSATRLYLLFQIINTIFCVNAQ